MYTCTQACDIAVHATAPRRLRWPLCRFSTGKFRGNVWAQGSYIFILVHNHTASIVLLIPDTKVRATLIYVDGGADTSAEDQRVAQLRRSLEEDLLRQIVPSIRVRYEQALKQKDTPKAD